MTSRSELKVRALLHGPIIKKARPKRAGHNFPGSRYQKPPNRVPNFVCANFVCREVIQL